MRIRKRWSVGAALLGGLVLLSACGGEAAQEPASPAPPGTTPQVTPGATVLPLTSPTVLDNCPPDPGPPATGSGGDLRGKIVFVRLVFGCQPEVYIMNADGSGATNLSNHPALDDEPDISPDGQKVVFFSLRDEGKAYLYVMNSDGSDLRRLTDGSGGDASPRWSPDGSRIAFSRNGSLAVMNADGSDLRVIMDAQAADRAEPCRAGSFVGGWSPDGRRITYYAAVLRSGGPASFWVCAIDADGSNIEVIVGEPAGKLHAEPYWSPDGKMIAFREEQGDCSQSGTATCDYDVYIVDIETGKKTNVTNHPALDIEPAWSPDGQWIVFASNRDDFNFDLYAVRPDGSDLRLILNDPTAKDSYPSWVP